MAQRFSNPMVQCIPALFLTYLLFCCAFAAAQTLTRESGRFLLDGVPLSPFGIRAANALNSDANVQALVASLDLMQAHGIQSVNVSLQCANTGSCNAYMIDGTLKTDVMARLDTVLAALRARGMVGVVTLFYVRREGELSSNARIYNAVRNVVKHVRSRRDIWLYVINEPNNSRFDRWAVGNPEIQANIYKLIKQEDPARITFVNEANNDGFVARTAGQPVCNGDVNVEMNRWDEYDSPGMFSTTDRATVQQLIRDTHACNGYFFFHAAWHQKSDAAGWPRFDKGGTQPGVAFAWDTMRELAALAPQPVPPPTDIHTENRRLMWEYAPMADLAGFRFYMRNALEGVWVKRMEIADPTTRSVDMSLAVGTWHLVITAFMADGRESVHSNEVVVMIEEPAPEAVCPDILPCECPACEACPTCPPLPTSLVCLKGFTAIPQASGGMAIHCID